MSGRLAVQSLLSCSSACDRKTLSPDDNACKSCVRVVWTSGGSIDILLTLRRVSYDICNRRDKKGSGHDIERACDANVSQIGSGASGMALHTVRTRNAQPRFQIGCIAL